MKLALLFPGQGSQRVGMGSDFRRMSQRARSCYEAASSILGYDLAAMCDNGPIEYLSRTIHAQPALYVTSCAALETLREHVRDIQPAAVAGHSVGEYAALYAAGAVTFEEGLRLVSERARLMDEAARARPGSMIAILGAEPDMVEGCCREASGLGVVVIANDNGAGQLVISGEQRAVEEAARLARERGARRTVPLAVSGGFHSPLMAEAAARMGSVLDTAPLNDPGIPIVTNVLADYCRTAECIRSSLRRQIAEGVRWRESMQRLFDDGAELLLELGAGEVLTGLAKRMRSEIVAIAVHDEASLLRAAEAARATQGGSGR